MFAKSDDKNADEDKQYGLKSINMHIVANETANKCFRNLSLGLT